jgi:hypothetical protein
MEMVLFLASVTIYKKLWLCHTAILCSSVQKSFFL